MYRRPACASPGGNKPTGAASEARQADFRTAYCSFFKPDQAIIPPVVLPANPTSQADQLTGKLWRLFDHCSVIRNQILKSSATPILRVPPRAVPAPDRA